MFIETYKNENIYKFNGFYQIGLNGASISSLKFLKKLIDIAEARKFAQFLIKTSK